MTNPENPTNEVVVSETRQVLQNGHKALLENAVNFKQDLMKPNSYELFKERLLTDLQSCADIAERARLLAILEEINVRDTSRIGESLIETLQYDLQTKAQGEFEFKKGDRNLAQAMLQLIGEGGNTAELISTLCEEQRQGGIATPFDYRRLTLGYEGSFETATPEQWLQYFRSNSIEQLRKHVEIGRSFASTKPQRYEEEEYAYLADRLRGKVRTLLDIGGSTGISAEYLMRFLKIPHTVVTDMRTEEELQASFYGNFKRNPNILYILGREGNITQATPTDETFDLVTVNNVLVHIRDKEVALSNILPRINPGGRLIISGGYNTNPPRIGLKVFKAEANGLSLEKEFKND